MQLEVADHMNPTLRVVDRQQLKEIGPRTHFRPYSVNRRESLQKDSEETVAGVEVRRVRA